MSEKEFVEIFIKQINAELNNNSDDLNTQFTEKLIMEINAFLNQQEHSRFKEIFLSILKKLGYLNKRLSELYALTFFD